MAFITAPDFGIASIDWTLDRPAQINMSPYDGVRTAVANPWHAKWRASVTLATLQGDSQFRTIRSFIARCRGSISTFRLYAGEAAQNANFGVSVASTAAQGATTMTLAGYTTPLLDGQMVTVNGQLLVLTADQSGASITFEPPLRAQATAGTTVVTSRPYALVYMTNSQLGYSIGNWRRYGVSFDVEEAVNETDGAPPEKSFIPSDLFVGGYAGGWYDPSDLSSMFQDTAGTTPVTAVGQGVARINDKSGNGNHLTQSTSTARPILRQDAGGRYYLEGDGVSDTLIGTATISVNTPAFVIAGLAALSQTGTSGVAYLFGPNATTVSALTLGIRSQTTSYVIGAKARFGGGTILNPTLASNLADYGTRVVCDGELTAAGLTLSSTNSGGNVGTATASGSIGGPASETIAIFNDAALGVDAAFYGGVIVVKALTSTERASVRTWLGAKCGIVM